MKIGFSTACLKNAYETEDALALLKEAGAEACEVYLKTFYEYRPDFAKKFAERAAGTEVISVHATPFNFEPQLFSCSRRERGDGFYWLDQILRSAQLFGAKSYTLRGIGLNLEKEYGFDGWGGYMRELTDFCAHYGVKLCLENGGIYNRPSVFGELKARCPQLTGALNLASARVSGYPYQMYLKDMCGAISHIYFTYAGENDIYNVTELFKTLKGEGFDGTAFIGCENLLKAEELAHATEIIREVIYNIK